MSVLWEKENQLDATQCFIELVICSICFGQVYAHHQELGQVYAHHQELAACGM